MVTFKKKATPLDSMLLLGLLLFIIGISVSNTAIAIVGAVFFVVGVAARIRPEGDPKPDNPT